MFFPEVEFLDEVVDPGELVVFDAYDFQSFRRQFVETGPAGDVVAADVKVLEIGSIEFPETINSGKIVVPDPELFE